MRTAFFFVGFCMFFLVAKSQTTQIRISEGSEVAKLIDTNSITLLVVGDLSDQQFLRLIYNLQMATNVNFRWKFILLNNTSAQIEQFNSIQHNDFSLQRILYKIRPIPDKLFSFSKNRKIKKEFMRLAKLFQVDFVHTEVCIFLFVHQNLAGCRPYSYQPEMTPNRVVENILAK